jgi:hypothetical protein
MKNFTLPLTLILFMGILLASCAPSTDEAAPASDDAQPPADEAIPASDDAQPPADADTPASSEEVGTEITALTASLGDEFQLSAGQTALVVSDGFGVKFVDVSEDSRCPTEVECEWPGQAMIVVAVSQDGQDLGTYSLTSTETYGGASTGRIAGYVVRLAEVAPYPQKVDEDIPLADYVVTLVISSTAASTPQQAALEEPFQLAIDQIGIVESEDLEITFIEIVEDTRCPLDVDCAWSGQAIVRVTLSKGNQAMGSFDLTTLVEGDTAVTSMGEYAVRLLEVAPYPQTVERRIPRSDYVITLIVVKPAG